MERNEEDEVDEHAVLMKAAEKWGSRTRVPNPPEVNEVRRRKREELAEKYGLNVRDLQRRRRYWLRTTWEDIVARCNKIENPAYQNYGGRGIKLYDEWDDSCTCGFEEFAAYVLSTLGPRPEGHTLDRIDNNQDYRPGNLQWAPPAEQAANRRPRGESPPEGRRGGERQTRELEMAAAIHDEVAAEKEAAKKAEAAE